uniref:(northern house mosquito) hypothetical protein n=1 Tax=Culex pipiens TaxID=7175 RepID=A0A8D8MAR3_CULPI
MAECHRLSSFGLHKWKLQYTYHQHYNPSKIRYRFIAPSTIESTTETYQSLLTSHHGLSRFTCTGPAGAGMLFRGRQNSRNPSDGRQISLHNRSSVHENPRGSRP